LEKFIEQNAKIAASGGKITVLREIKVKDFGIIEDVDWKLDEGLNVITGETGAGKSLVIDAVELLFTGTSSDEVIRYGAEEARIEGIITILYDPRFLPIQNFLDEKGLTGDDDTLIINCAVRRQKPGINRINGHPVTKTILRQIGQLLIDIHGQSQHLSLLDKKYHLDFLDAYAHTIELKNKFSAEVTHLNNIRSEIQTLEAREKDTLRQEEFLKYQVGEIQRANLQEGEDEELEKERKRIAFSEKLKEYTNRVYEALVAGEGAGYSTSALTRLNEALQVMRKLAELDQSLNSQIDYLEKTVYGVEELARDVQAYGEKLEYEPGRLEEIESRLEVMRNLKRKYGPTIGEVVLFREKAEKELAGIGLSSEKRLQLEKEQIELKTEMGRVASELSQKRKQAAQQLMNAVGKELQDLEMSQMQFGISFKQTPSADGITGPDGKIYEFSNEGFDDVEFLVSTNPGEPLRPLAKIASTGEISRFTLALKGALSEADNIPVLIFDEIDIGVGGRSGQTIGRKLWALAGHHQVICVTHLPQIAAYADAHFCVSKETVDARTTSVLENLSASSRLNELALMLAGPGYTQTALKNATELLRAADDWKKPLRKSPDKQARLQL
jgi:DNA repair protein RecN (Recombination protein N)